MAAILQQLSGNPLSTAIGQKIEQATDPSLNSENWALNMEICDMINDTDEGPKDAIRAIKKKLQLNAGKNHDVIMFTLIVLETCVKNCGKRFHLLVTNKDFIQELIKIIGPKYDPPAALQEKILSLIQTWAETFRGQPEFSGVTQIYAELKQKGIEFPLSNLDSTAPIHTPQRSIPPPPVQTVHSLMSQTPATAVAAASAVNTNAAAAAVVAVTAANAGGAGVNNVGNQLASTLPKQRTHHRHIIAGPINLNAEQLNKLNNELEIVKGNMVVLDEMLTELKPGEEHKDDFDLLSQVHETCQAMQKRIVELIEKVANEEITNELLRINDELNTLFLRYERFVKRKSQGSKQEAKNEQEKSLIDLSEDAVAAAAAASGGAVAGAVASATGSTATGPAAVITASSSSTVNQSSLLSSQLSKINVSGNTAKPALNSTANTGDADFDVFAQYRSSASEKLNKAQPAMAAATATAATAIPSESDLQNEQDFEEMEKWLKEQTPIVPAMSTGTSHTTTTTNNNSSLTAVAAGTTATTTTNESSAAFEKFLEERAFVAETLPNRQQDQKMNKPSNHDPFGL